MLPVKLESLTQAGYRAKELLSVTMGDIRVSIDRGGTFCDVIAHIEGKEPLIFKLLSVDAASYPDAPTEAIRRVLEVAEGKSISKGTKLDGSRICKQGGSPICKRIFC